MKVYTRSGDSGETNLLFGGRVSKNDPRPTACGAIDEANSALGMARAVSTDETVRTRITHVQRELFVVGGELATSTEHREMLEKDSGVVTSDMTARLESWIDEIDSKIELPNEFILPGGSPASAAIDLARTVVRRAERDVVGLQHDHLLANDEILRYLNRLSDFLFMLGRYEDRKGTTETRSGGTGAAFADPGDEKA